MNKAKVKRCTTIGNAFMVVMGGKIVQIGLTKLEAEALKIKLNKP